MLNALRSCHTRIISCHIWLLLVTRDGLFSYPHMFIHVNTDLKNMCYAEAMSRLPLNDPERNEVPLPSEVVFLLQTLDYSPITSNHIRIMTLRYPVLSKILDYVTTGSWPSNCIDTNMSAYFNKQDEIYIEQGCVLWGTRVIIPSRGRERVL